MMSSEAKNALECCCIDVSHADFSALYTFSAIEQDYVCFFFIVLDLNNFYP